MTPQRPQSCADLREALYNERAIGPAVQIQRPAECITTLHGILLDLDPKLYRPGNTIFPPAEDPRAFHDLIRPVLDRHPLARFAEVRKTGTGLHAIVWLDPPVELDSAAAQGRWDAIVGAVQSTLPVDVSAPRLTALTRPIRSVNSKNGVVVEMLRPGMAVDVQAVEEFVARLVKAPFQEVAMILLGERRVSPCPVCQGEGTRLDVLDHVGKCYGNCDKVTLAQLLDCVYAPLAQVGKTASPPGKEGQQAAPEQHTPERADSTKRPKKARSTPSKRAAGKTKANDQGKR